LLHAFSQFPMTTQTLALADTLDPAPRTMPTRRISTQIGIVTLHEFLLALHLPSAQFYTMTELIEAFIAMSSYEREELDFGSVHKLDAATVQSNRRLQHRILIGSIKLIEFLKEVRFGTAHVAKAHAVVEAWEMCARRDQEAEELDERLGEGEIWFYEDLEPSVKGNLG
jgi:hypothetical protein